ncbi:hypothetical protein [Ilumatobacter sp.]|uniref:hypothetical protein n=1 Tax=Ilumatobacter sp. TaxID=1967498 RepID=UPI003B528A3D
MPATPRAILACVALAATVTGCALGERPTLLDPPDTVSVADTGNAAIDDVLARLDSVDSGEFTASYSIETLFGSVSSTALVVVDDELGRSVTVTNDARAVRFLDDGSTQRTCDLVGSTCEQGLNDARISDTQLPHRFYGPAFAARLRADAARRIADPVGSSTDIAGRPAVCVDVDVSGGTKTYCALESGPLARFVGIDVGIELTSFAGEPDRSAFSTEG